MIYSCFDAAQGMYRYFSDEKSRPLNADLPIPSFDKGAHSKIGVTAVAAARPFPDNARFIGTGWYARGMVVKCHGDEPLGTWNDPSTWPSWWPWAAGGLAGALAFYLWRKK